MSVHTGVDPRTLSQLGADIGQLVRPIHIAVRRQIITHPCLLDQLRAAVGPGAVPRQGRPQHRQRLGSRLPLNLGAMEALSTLYVELSGWHARLGLASPPWYRIVVACDHWSCRAAVLGEQVGPACHRPTRLPVLVDWQKWVLGRLVGIAPTLAPSMADWLATEVHDWWRSAVVQSGWSARECLNVR